MKGLEQINKKRIHDKILLHSMEIGLWDQTAVLTDEPVLFTSARRASIEVPNFPDDEL